MNYIVMDLEWNQSYNGHMGEHPRMPFEIIEIGAVKVDKNLNIIDEYSSLIKPKIYKKLHSKIRTILNYDEDDLSLGRGFKEVCSEFLDWCGKITYSAHGDLWTSQSFRLIWTFIIWTSFLGHLSF